MRHGLCNAHALRDLNYVIDTRHPAWAKEMRALLLDIKAAVNEAREVNLRTKKHKLIYRPTT
jgi:transposase